MKTIYKYPLNFTDHQTVVLPKNYRIVSIINQKEVPVLYAQIDTDTVETEILEVAIRGTGHYVSGLESYNFISTLSFSEGDLIFHFFVRSF